MGKKIIYVLFVASVILTMSLVLIFAINKSYEKVSTNFYVKKYSEYNVLKVLQKKGLTLDDGFMIAQTIIEEGEFHNIPPQLILAIVEVESSFRKDSVSKKRAMGLMQIRKDTWDDAMKKIGGNIPHHESKDLQLNISVGIFVLSDLIAYCKEKYKKDYLLYTLASYYQGRSYVEKNGISKSARYYYDKVVMKMKEYDKNL